MMENIDLQHITDNYVIPWGVNIALAIVIFFVGKFAVGVLTNVARKLMKKAKMDNILVNFVGSIIKTILLLFVVIASLDQLGVDTSSLIALIAAAGLAIGLALQSSLQNLASGVMLIIFRPFKDGDFVDAGGAEGTVVEIGIFTTTMVTGDNRQIIIPNGEVFGGTIINYSKKDTRRIDMVFGIGYDDDIRKAKEIIKSIIDADARILKEPEALIAVGELADSSVNFNVRPWVKTSDYSNVLYDLNEKIKLAFDENSISIPYPQLDIHQDKAV